MLLDNNKKLPAPFGREFFLFLYPIVFRGGKPDYEVGPEAKSAKEEGNQEQDANHGGVDVEVAG